MTKEEIVDKIWDADGQLKMTIILNPDSRKIYESMDQYAKQQAIAFITWVIRGEGDLAVMYVDQSERFVDTKREYTPEEVYSLFLTHQSI